MGCMLQGKSNYILRDSSYMMFWKRQNCGGKVQEVSGTGEGGITGESQRNFRGSADTLYETIRIDLHIYHALSQTETL